MSDEFGSFSFAGFTFVKVDLPCLHGKVAVQFVVVGAPHVKHISLQSELLWR